MAVYTYFGGMPGLWGAVRQEGFVRLAERLSQVSQRTDPVQHLAELGVAYTQNALAHPDLYRVMFDSAYDLPDPGGANAAFLPLVDATRRAQTAGRFDDEPPAEDLATRYWATGHGITSLAVTGVLAPDVVRRHAQATAVALFTEAGDVRQRAQRSVARGWRSARW